MPVSERESVVVRVSEFRGAWEWSVIGTTGERPRLLGAGTAPGRAEAWADAASVVNDQGEAHA